MSYTWSAKYEQLGGSHKFTLKLSLDDPNEVRDLFLHGKTRNLGYILKDHFLQALLDGQQTDTENPKES